MPLTAVQKVETFREIGQGVETRTVQDRDGAAVITPFKAGGVTVALGLEELGYGRVEEKTVGLTFFATLWVSSLEREGEGERHNCKSGKERECMHSWVLGVWIGAAKCIMSV